MTHIVILAAALVLTACSPRPCRTDAECTDQCNATHAGTPAQCADIDFATPDIQAQAWERAP
jgi:hypothetical protein